MLLAANAPDIDVVSAVGGSLEYLKYHRHFTHSLAMAPVMALLPLLVVRLAVRKPMAWKTAYLTSLAGVISHLALDFTNIYGIRLLLPFSRQWLRLDITSVIDPWIWAALLLAVVAPALARLVSSEIGAPARHGRTAAVFALAFILLYDCARAVIHERAIAILDTRIYEGFGPRRVAAFPEAWSPFAWRGLAEGPSFYKLLPLNVRQSFDPTEGATFYPPDDTAAIQRASDTEAFRVFLDFSPYPAWTVTPLSEPAGGKRVQVVDLRFGTPREPGFTAIAILDAESRVVQSWFSFLRPIPR